MPVEVPDLEAIYNGLTTDADKAAFIANPLNYVNNNSPKKTVRIENTQSALHQQVPYHEFRSICSVDPADPTKNVAVGSVL